VQEHGNEDGNKKTCPGQVYESVAGDISRRDDSIEGNQPVDAAALRQFEEEDQDIGDDEGKGYEPKAPPPDVVGEGEGHHERSIQMANGKTQMANVKPFEFCHLRLAI
jgi:hypothetical protein